LSAPLPVTLMDFNGQLANNLINLDWSTAQELNSKYFDVEKSYAGLDFFKIGTVNARGNTNSITTYHLTDLRPAEFNYYRLKMVDADGHYTYSKTILIKNPSIKQDIQVLNNPFESFIKLRFTKQPKSEVHVQLLTANGAKVFDQQLTASYELSIDLSSTNLSRGVYFLRAELDGELFVRKLVRN
jgi:trimeric autotransporter adhesin